MPDYTGLYRGAVQNINDPENRGRIQVLVPAALGDAVSAWAEPVLPTAQYINWRVGDRVFVMFEDGDVNRPAYVSRMEVRGGDIAAGAVGPDELSEYAITTEHLTANDAFIRALSATDFSAVTITSPTIQSDPNPNRGVKWDTTLRAYGPTGDLFFNVDPIGGLAMVAGLITSRTLTVSDPVTIGNALASGQPVPTLSSLGGITEVANSGAIRLTGGTTPPASAPRLDFNYDTMQYQTSSVNWSSINGVAYDGSSVWALGVDSSSGNYPQLYRFDSSGNKILQIGLEGMGGTAQACGVAYAATSPPTIYALAAFTNSRQNTTEYFIYDLNVLNPASPIVKNIWQWTGNDGTRIPSIGWDPGTNEVFIAQSRESVNYLWVKRYARPSVTATSWPSYSSVVNGNFSYYGQTGAILYGTFDFAGPRYIFTNYTTGGIRSMDTSGNEQVSEGWPSGTNDKAGLYHNGTQFIGLDGTGVARYYTNLWSIVDDNMTKWVANTLVGSNSRTATVTLTNGSTSISGQFSTADNASPISGPGIPVGATVTRVTDLTATLSLPATANGPVSATISSLLETTRSPYSSITLPKRSKLMVIASSITKDLTGVPDSIYVYVGQNVRYTVTSKVLSSNTATLTVGTHSLVVGNTVTVSGVGSPFDGTWTVSAVTGTTFSYAVTAPNVAATAVSGTVVRSTYPSRTQMARQANPAIGANTAAYSSLVPPPGTNPPATGTFPSSVGSSVQDRLGNLIIDQDGVFRKGTIANDTFLTSLLGWVAPAQGSYSVAWTGSTSNPALGNGTLTGTFRRVGNVVDFKITLIIGSSTNFGVGGWFFSLPVAAADIRGVVGRAVFRAGTTDRTRTAILNGSNNQFQLQTEDGVRFAATDASTTYAMVSGDSFYISGRYETA